MTDEDAELKDVLIRSLNETGILPRLQAQLRAAVYLALEKHNYHEKIPPANGVMRNLCSTEDGLIIVSLKLIAEFLSYADLGNTLEVLKHEAELDRLSLIDRPTLHSLLNLDETAGATLLKLASTRRAEVRSVENPASSAKKGPTDTTTSKPSRIPTLSNRRTSVSSSHDQSVDAVGRINGHVDQIGSDGMTDSDSRPSSSSRSAATPSPGSGVPKPDSADPLRRTPTNDPHDSRTGTPGSDDGPGALRPSVNSNSRVNNIQTTPSPRDPEYQDDFDSPRSLGSSKTVSASASPHVDVVDQRNSPRPSLEKLAGDSVSSGSALGTAADAPRSTTPMSNRLGIISPGPGELGANRLDSRSSSPSVIRVYTRFKKPPASGEPDSDVDGEDEDIPELVKELEYSGEEDTIDQTIDSDESLGLDHVEDVMSPRKPITPTA